MKRHEVFLPLIHGSKPWTLLGLVFVLLLPCIFFEGAAWGETTDISSLISVTTANERSVLDRRTRMITSTADVTLANSSSKTISAPLHAVIDIVDTDYSNVTMPDALGGYGVDQYGKYYYDLSGRLPSGILQAGESVTFRVTFVRFYTIRFRYNVIPYGTVEAGPVNQVPTAHVGGPYAGVVGQPIAFDGSGSSDPDGDTLTYAWDFGDGDSGAGPNPSHTYLSEATYSVILTVNDGRGGSDAASAQVTVIAGNQAPSLDPIGDQTVDEGQYLTFPVTGSDPDNDFLTFEASGLPAGATFEPDSATFSWTPDYDQSGEYTVTFSVSDPEGLHDSAGVRITVNNVNRAPVAVITGPDTVETGQTVELTGGGATDPDGDPLTYSWMLISKPVESTAVLSDNESMSVFLVADSGGLYVVQLVVNDGELDSLPATITIEALSPGNNPPVITSEPVLHIELGQSYLYDVDAKDPDPDDVIEYFLDVSPTGMTIEPFTGIIEWTPAEEQAGTHEVAVQVSDEQGGSDWQEFTVEVLVPGDWFVDGEAPSGGDGMSWETAFNTIQEAVDAASDGEEIWVKAGTYHLRNTVLIDKAIRLYGGFAGGETSRLQRDWENNVTAISGEHFLGVGFRIKADAVMHGFTVTRCFSAETNLAGAIMINDASPTISHCIFIQNRGEEGGAIRAANSSAAINASATITDCTFLDNAASYRGGAIQITNCSPIITRCVFMGNTATFESVMRLDSSSPIVTQSIFIGNHGQGTIHPVIGAVESSPIFRQCDFTGNMGLAVHLSGTADDQPPMISDCSFVSNNPVAVNLYGSWSGPTTIIEDSRFVGNHGYKALGSCGAAICSDRATASITNCLFEKNSSRDVGGAIYNNNSTIAISDSIFKANVSEVSGGGAMKNQNSSHVSITNSLFEGNATYCWKSGSGLGGAIFNSQSSPVILNSTFVGNRVRDKYRLKDYERGAIGSEYSSMPVIANSIFWDNGQQAIWDLRQNTLSANVTFSLIDFYDAALAAEAYHNMDAAPGFVDKYLGDFRLLPDSPAVDAGTLAVPDPPGLPLADLDGNIRILDGNGDGAALPDMGAYEYVPGAGGGSPGLPPSNTAPVAKADARMNDDYTVKDYGASPIHYVGDTVQLDGSGSQDADGDPLSFHWSFVHIPSRSAATVSHPNDPAPTFVIDANGVYVIELTVSDGTTESEPDFLVIFTTNRYPVVSPAPDITVNVGEPVQLSVDHVYDPDGDYLSYRWVFSPGFPYYEYPGKPSGSSLSIDDFVGPNPTFVPDVPGVYSFVLYPFDGYNEGKVCSRALYLPATYDTDPTRCDYQRVFAQVSGNTPPVITSTPKTTATVVLPNNYSYRVEFEDLDDTFVALSLDVWPEGMHFYVGGSYKWYLKWTPRVDQLGEHEVVIRVVDLRGSYSFQHFTVTVSNDPPLFTSTPVTVATEGVLYTCPLAIIDPDQSDLQGIRLELITKPQGMFINSSNALQWTPSSQQVGDNPVTVRVTDAGGLSATQSFIVSVKENKPPIILSSGGTAATEAIWYVYPVKVWDEGGPLVFSLEDPPGGALGMSINPSTGMIEWFPITADVGAHDIVVCVTDSVGWTAYQTYTLEVYDRDDSDLDGDSYSKNDGDCNDTDPAIHPGAFDIAANGIDEDCDGWDAETSIRITTSEGPVELVQHIEGHVGFMIAFRSVDTGEYDIEFALTVVPDDGTLIVDTAFPSEVTTSGSRSWNVGLGITGNTLGTYELTAMATVVQTGQTDQVTTQINIGSGEENPILYPLGSDPDAISISTPTDVLFTTVLAGANLKPVEVVLEEVDGPGNAIRTLGSLVDDGTSGDLSPDDYVYSGTFLIESDLEGERFYRVRASFSGIAGSLYSDVYALGVTRFPTDIRPSDMSMFTMDFDTGEVFLSNEVLVSFVDGTDPDRIETIVESVEGAIVGMIYGLGYYQIEIVGTGDAGGVKAVIASLETVPEVLTAEPVFIAWEGAVTPNDPEFNNQWGLEKIRADEAWVIARGDATVIAVIDTGVDYDHPDLDGKIIRGRNYCSPSGPDDNPRDDNGHGTHVAGIAAANTNNADGVAGVSWGSKVLAVKVLDAKGRGTSVSGARGLKYAKDKGVKIINMSLEVSSLSSALSDAVDYAASRGALIIAAAGNGNCKDLRYPAACPEVLAVGNVTANDNRSATSNYGDWVDVAAPGTNILSTMPTYEVKTNSPPHSLAQDYDYMTGTSMASPMVAGAAAVVWSRYPAWTARQVRNRLEKTAQPLPSLRLGKGIVDLFEALFNGSFESGRLDGWKATSTTGNTYEPGGTPVARTGPPIDPLIPIDHPSRVGANRAMAYLDNSGAVRSGTEISQSFRVQPGVTSTPFSFNAYFITDEYPEWWSVGACYQDWVTVIVAAPSEASVYKWVQFVDNIGDNRQFSQIDIGGPGLKSHPYDIEIPWCGGEWITNQYVGVQRYNISGVIPFTEGAGVYTIYISVMDEWDTIGDSAVLIDNIRFR